MSWYVEILLRNSTVIHDSPIQKVGEFDNSYQVDLTGNDYNNLLLLEKMVNQLHVSGDMTPREMELLDSVATNKSFRQLEKYNKDGRRSLAKQFYSICEKLAARLGGEFTNEGYLKYIENKYNLDAVQLEKAAKYMQRSSQD